MCILTEVEEELSKEKELLGDGVSPEGEQLLRDYISLCLSRNEGENEVG